MSDAVSAFAARKAHDPKSGQAQQQIEVEEAGVTAARPASRTLSPPRKKRKTLRRLQNIPKQANGRSCPVSTSHKQIVAKKQDRGNDVVTILRTEDDSFDDAESQVIDGSSSSESRLQDAAPVQRLSTFSPTKTSVLSENDTAWTVRLLPEENLAILGSYDLWVRKGAISVLGAVIHASATLHRVYAPSTHAIPPIKAIPNPYDSGSRSADITVYLCKSRIRLLRQIAPKFGRIWNGRTKGERRRSFASLRSSADDPHERLLRLLDIPLDWQTTISKIVSSTSKRASSIMVCGPKGSGKSTFCRTLVNAFLSKRDFVTFIDLDPGQPEYSPPGELSLLRLRRYNLGPPFTHPISVDDNDLIRSHHFGHNSPKEDSARYQRCASDLVDHYRQDELVYGDSPLIINSSGWIQGSGLECLISLIYTMDLTDIIYMSTEGPAEIVDTLTTAATKANVPLYQLTSQTSGHDSRSAADFRMMQTLSYFHLDEPEGGNLRWEPRPLSSIAPLVVHYEGPQQAILAVTVLGDEQNPEYLDTILGGCIVGILYLEDETVIANTQSPHPDESMGQETHDPDTGVEMDEESAPQPSNHISIKRNRRGIPYITANPNSTFPLAPEHSRSLGQALIRSIDHESKTFQILTPAGNTFLQSICPSDMRRIVLVRGTLDTPTWAYSEQLHFERDRQRSRERELNLTEGFGQSEAKEWAQRQPWASIAEGGRTASAKARRVRRDIRYKER